MLLIINDLLVKQILEKFDLRRGEEEGQNCLLINLPAGPFLPPGSERRLSGLEKLSHCIKVNLALLIVKKSLSILNMTLMVVTFFSYFQYLFVLNQVKWTP